jgi:hypothetical protein
MTFSYYGVCYIVFFFNLVCEAIGTAATPGLLCQPRVIVKMIVEKQMECIGLLAGETEVFGENLPQRHFCPSQNSTWPDPSLNRGRRGGKPATNRLSYGAALYSNIDYAVLRNQCCRFVFFSAWGRSCPEIFVSRSSYGSSVAILLRITRVFVIHLFDVLNLKFRELLYLALINTIMNGFLLIVVVGT